MQSSRSEALLRRAVGWLGGWLFAAALYLLLIDVTDLPELIVGAVAAAIAATGFELAREQRIASEAIRPRWLRHAYRPVLKVPTDIGILLVVAVRQLVRPKAARGEFRVVPFRARGDGAHETGRRALAEASGSFAPNTIVVGVDGDRELILAHQLRRTGERDAIDLLRIG